MLRSIEAVIDSKLAARDGEIGRCVNFLYDTEKWKIRHMVANSGSWLQDRLVLISPSALGTPNWERDELPVDLSREQIRKSPPIDRNLRFDRKFEEAWLDYFKWPKYWLDEKHQLESELFAVEKTRGYEVTGQDGKVGTLEDFIIDDDTWEVRFLVVDTGQWLPGKKVLVSPNCVSTVAEREAAFHIVLDNEDVENSMEFDPSRPVNRVPELNFYDYFGRRVATA